MALIDLDAARAAEKEVKKDGPVVRFGGKDYVLPARLPFAVLEAFRGVDVKATQPSALAAITVALMGEDNIEQMKADGLSIEDMDPLITGVLQEYGVGGQTPLPSSIS